MISRNLLFIALSILVFSTSCLKQPTADFTFEPADNPESGEVIEFTNTSLDAKYYYWDFGNGQTSEEESPTTEYATPGDYTITLVAESTFRSDTMQDRIVINPPTILKLYVFDEDAAPIASGQVYLFNDLNEFTTIANSIGTQNTDQFGCATFYNLDAKRYYAYFEKGAGLQAWVTGGYVGPLVQNQINEYFAQAQLMSKKSMKNDVTGHNFTKVSGVLPAVE